MFLGEKLLSKNFLFTILEELVSDMIISDYQDPEEQSMAFGPFYYKVKQGLKQEYCSELK